VRRLTAYLLLALATAGLITTAGTAGASTYSPSSYASRLLELTNQARAAHGLATLTWASGTSEVAASWTSHLASARALSHNPNLASDVASHGSPNWTDLGENVGEGGVSDPDALFNAYMASPEHRANILEPGYRYVGVGVVFTGSDAWNTFDFVDTYGATRTTTQATKPTATKPRSGGSTQAAAPTPVQPAAPAVQPAPAAAAPSAPAPAARPAKPATKPAPKPAKQQRAARPERVRVAVNDPVPSYLWRAAPAAQVVTVGSGSGADPRRPVVLAVAAAMLLLAGGSWLARPRLTA
jgi:hypothetical protein